MAVDPRKYTKNFKCAKSAAFESQSQAAKRDALAGLGKIGGIETGLGITDKLNSFVSLSNSGGPALNKILNDGVNGTLQILGMNPETVNTTLASVNPSAVNTGIGAIKSMHERMKQGSLSSSNLPAYARDLNALKGTYNNLTIKQSVDDAPSVECKSSPYAMDLVKYGIKHKFLFVVEFIFNDPYHSGAIDTNPNIVATMVKQTSRPSVTYEHEEVNMYNFRTKIIKNSTFEPIEMVLIDDDKNYTMEFLMNYIRETVPITNGYTSPKLFEENGMSFEKKPVNSDQYEFQTEIRNQNTRNFETVVGETTATAAAKKADADRDFNSNLKALAALNAKGIISGTEHDNRVRDLENSRKEQEKAIQQNQDNTLAIAATTYQEQAANLGELSENVPSSQVGSSSIGSLNNNRKTILKEIRLFHVYNFGTLMNVYHIHNPKILQATFDELNMEDSLGNYITINIGYDAFDVNTSVPLHGIPDNSLPTSSDTLGVNYHLHDSTYTTDSAYETGAFGNQVTGSIGENFDKVPEPQFSTTDPLGNKLYSDDGANWRDANGVGLAPGATVGGQTFNPPNITGKDSYGLPTSDGKYPDYDSMFTP